ncbi:MAG: sortase [Anaerolineales bacterium]|jgi:LPXTG-site transpeptidase (sortase) family protein
MKQNHRQLFSQKYIKLVLTAVFVIVIVGTIPNTMQTTMAAPSYGTYSPQGVIDQTFATPLSNPVPGSFEPRYISGFGLDDNFTIFFEDRNAGGRISYIQTTTGVTGLPATITGTNIPSDLHFVIKPWPWPDTGGVQYNYRAWTSAGNNPDHRFYGSNDLINWTLISTFTIPDAPGFTGSFGNVHYGFHDVIRIPQTSGPDPYHYYAWGETNLGQTLFIRSFGGGDGWEAFAGVGGVLPAHGPLTYPEPATPKGSFFDLGYDRGYGKIQIRGSDTGIYLAVNTEAKASLPPAQFEAAFIDPNNWTWHDDTTGLMSSPLLTATAEHDLREAWLVPKSDPDDPWLVVYDADYGAADGDLALGYFTIDPQLAPVATPSALPDTGFPPGQISWVKLQSPEEAYTAYDELILDIPKLDVRIPIVGVPRTGDGWDVSWLNQQAGYLEGTSFPTWAGNTGLTAHVWDANNKPGPFAELWKMRFGDEIIIRAWGYAYVYQVRENDLVSPGAVSVLKHEDYDWVTLITCQGYDTERGDYRYRRVLRAVLVDVSSE